MPVSANVCGQWKQLPAYEAFAAQQSARVLRMWTHYDQGNAMLNRSQELP
jgi:hypothetical protein